MAPARVLSGGDAVTGLSYHCGGCGRAVGRMAAPYRCRVNGLAQPAHEPIRRDTRPRPIRQAIAGTGEALDAIIKRLDDNRARQQPKREIDWAAVGLLTTRRRPVVETAPDAARSPGGRRALAPKRGGCDDAA